MRSYQNTLYLFSLLLCFIFACDKTETTQKQEPAACVEAREKDSQIQSLIQNLSCTDSNQCKAIAYGHKACGGPEKYLVYSTQSVDEITVNGKITEYNTLKESCVIAQKMASDCSVPIEPTLSCLLGLCVGTTP